MNLQKKIHSAAAVLFLVLGTLCLFAPVLEARIFYWCAVACISVSALILWVRAFRKRHISAFAEAGLVSLLCLFFWMEPLLKTDLIVIVFSLYMLGIAFCLAVQILLDFRDHTEQRWSHLLLCLLYLALGLLAFFWRRKDLALLMVYFGLYLYLQAFQLLLETFFLHHPGLNRDFLISRWMSLPVYLVSFLPGLFLRLLLKKETPESAEYDARKNDLPVNLRVFIHTGLSGEHLVGHMTFSSGGIMYSYGNYDAAHKKLRGTIGPGVFFTVPANLYVNNSCIYEQSVLFEYGIHLEPEQLEKLHAILQELEKNTVPWQCPLEASGDPVKNFPEYESDYASRLWYRTGASFSKFLSGPWKTYWVMGDNCSLFAEDILSRIGCDIVHKSGIVSPGEYFEFFEAAFRDPDSCVVARSWHDASHPETLFPVKQISRTS